MKIEKVLNNNMVLTYNTEGKEIILKGKAIGFGKKKGDEVDHKLVERVFIQNDKRDARHFEEYFAKLPQEYWEISEQTADFAKSEFGMQLDTRIILTICDHIAGAVERYKEGVILRNAMLWEGKRFYPSEFKVGQYAVDLIRRRLNISMEEDEAMFLAFHFVYGQNNRQESDNLELITGIIRDIVDIVEAAYQVKLNTETWDYRRFVTHIRFFAQRMLQNKQYETTDDEWYQLLKNKYRKSYNCIVKIADYIHDRYYYEMDREEMMYLMIHIEKVTRELI
ncbi:PRD domain-containing protein [Clostridium boliviensis]|uniref:PRD domain-containing protein n=1 Tax=Clostridium boliviensis TaxID=318465 RepID=A0ABU4GJK1_9CLOT|nr:PRD domain-containing protein [Clostridium boliviensis]MDW2797783.1 PRD domain-containing protein [Clostridium boliviensis]